jgi:hypothetical protein
LDGSDSEVDHEARPGSAVRWTPAVELNAAEKRIAKVLTRIGKFYVFLREIRDQPIYVPAARGPTVNAYENLNGRLIITLSRRTGLTAWSPIFTLDSSSAALEAGGSFLR